ncbi:uncharacterized protein EKO05_0003465 [Ascochyta rabiei]|uniref:Retrovirus-related Pol polyprotein from transposon TNT 1-94-like beta-barrel domain-containing protein n=1 Tax=Didymella rabiei TaxID=5454 RepID=A0A163GBP3_DIDRA|nr:uncharacterized protein EKO05_0003465 [Ascochyta rabiei]KZM24784.1 hypothetical protein ST47_g4076 [Ascochyta rabiei]UPX12933.1 hypothetical protein EKO05_0003465 [Ascochyta rabiei]
MAGSGNVGLCPDWIYSDSSNVHVAKDKAWFTSYHPFRSSIGSVYNIGDPIQVVGIGTVEFEVKARPRSFGTSTIQLHNVLHAPNYICNVLGRPITSVYTIGLGGSVPEGGPPSRGGLFLAGRQVAHFQPGPIGIFSLAVPPPAGRAFGASPFRVGTAWVVSCHWATAERVRWQELRALAARELEPPKFSRPYTMRELEYVDGHWGTEFGFLTLYRLGIGDERDRSEGRRIVRALMAGRDPAAMDGEKDVHINGRFADYKDSNKGVFPTHSRSPRAQVTSPFLGGNC